MSTRLPEPGADVTWIRPPMSATLSRMLPRPKWPCRGVAEASKPTPSSLTLVLEAIRREVGRDWTVGMRISGDEMTEGGYTSEDFRRLIPYLTASDSGSGMLPAALAGLLDWPLIAGVVWARQEGEVLKVEAATGAGKRALYRLDGPAVLSAAWLGPPTVYAPLARRLAAERAAIVVRDAPGGASAAERTVFLGFGPGKPRTRHLIQPSAAQRPGDRLSQLMAGGSRRSASKLSGDAEDLARQLLALLSRAGLLPD